ncbi:hypothetical protein AzCIB_3829 [Azoarcus sp. CIB]|uniref:DUF7024 domain-containing protein n=1 Tax=Aromatoleum sp. (strain CIB) TaxID=198107 RepID=UPI0006A2882C|nr:hypothetical protein [Azoarcus sp. CIB]AKU13722.1 hypothetical protein AzCIB_3829 [Azoarcus sp. CIB]
MKNSSDIAQRWLTAVTIAAMILTAAPQLWSTSVDFAHHYALVARLSEFWAMPLGVDPSLGEMNQYPRYAHVAAAIVGILVNSPLLGMHLVGVIAFVLLWYFISAILLRQDDVDLPASLIFAVAMLAIAGRMGLEIHGYEIVENYFFSQVVGQAVVFLALVVHAWGNDKYGSPLAGYVVLAIFGVLSAGIHLLPAMELLGILVIYFVTDLFIIKPARRAIPLFGVLILIAAGTALIMHPSFAAMKVIAAHNGGMHLKFTPTLNSMTALCVVVIALSVIGLVMSLRDAARTRAYPAIRIVSAYGLVVAGLFLLQRVSFFFGQGSEYACKKYGFGLNTAAVLLLALFVPKVVKWFAPSFVERWRAVVKALCGGVRFVFPAVILVCGVLVVSPGGSVANVKRLSEVESVTRGFHAENPLPGDGRSDVFLGGRTRRVDDYLMTIAPLHHPRDGDAHSIFYQGALPKDGSKLRYVITDEDSGLRSQECVKSRLAAGLMVVDAQCAIAQGRLCRDFIDFSESGNSLLASVDGFSLPESFGRWSDQSVARFSCVLPDRLSGRVKYLRIIFASAYVGNSTAQRVTIVVNNSARKTVELSGGPSDVVLDIGNVDFGTDRVVTVDFDIPGAVAPQEIGRGADPRRLGVAIKSISIVSES